MAVIGNSAPAKKKGTMASAGTTPMYSSTEGMRLATVSAMPYIATARSALAAQNHATPVTDVLRLAPRRTAAASSTTTWSAVTANATMRLASTIVNRRNGAA